MQDGVQEFTKAASHSYHAMSATEKGELRDRCKQSESKPLSAKEVKRSGNRIFNTIKKQVLIIVRVHFKVASYRDYRDILVKHPITARAVIVLYSLHSWRYSLQLTIMCLQVKLLEDLGYSGFALGFFEEDIHFVSTSNATHCSHPNLIQYLVSLIMARK